MEFENRLLYKFLVKDASAIDLLRSVFVGFRSSWHPFPQSHLSSLWDNWQSYSHSLCTDKKLTLVSRQKNDVQILKQDLNIIHLWVDLEDQKVQIDPPITENFLRIIIIRIWRQKCNSVLIPLNGWGLWKPKFHQINN